SNGATQGFSKPSAPIPLHRNPFTKRLDRNRCAGLSRWIGFGDKVLKSKSLPFSIKPFLKRLLLRRLTTLLPGVFAQAFFQKACEKVCLVSYTPSGK
ncbi:MAG: hypothetical protein WAO81_02835, partial [Methanosarcina flavescens]